MVAAKATIRHPALVSAVACTIGTVAGRFCAVCGVSYWIIAAATVPPVALLLAFRRSRTAGWLAVVVAASFLRAALAFATSTAAGRDFAQLSNSDDSVAVTGEVAAIFKGQPAGNDAWCHRFTLRNATFRHRGPPRSLPGAVLIEWYSAMPEAGGRAPARGETIEATGHVYARRAFTGRVPTVEDVRLVSGATRTRLLDFAKTPHLLERIRRSASATLSHGLSRMPRERDLILAMTLGLRSEVSPETLDAFRRAGTIHIFAISGLHVGVIALIIVRALSLIGVPRNYVFLPLTPLLIAYVYMTGLQPSAVRATLMVCIYFFAVFIGRRPDPLDSMAITLLGILAVEPQAIAETSLVMSFSMVAGIILFTGPITKLLLGALGGRLPSLLSVAGSEAPRRRIVRFVAIYMWNYCLGLLAAAIGAALVSFPLTAHIFHSFIPYSLLANFFTVPLALPIMVLAGSGLFLSSILPGIEFATNFAAALMAKFLCNVSFGVANLPYASFRGDFPLWALAAWYLALFILLRGLPGVCPPVIRHRAESV